MPIEAIRPLSSTPERTECGSLQDDAENVVDSHCAGDRADVTNIRHGWYRRRTRDRHRLAFGEVDNAHHARKSGN